MIGLVMAICFISHLNRASMSVAGTDRIMGEYSLTPVQMGWVYSSFLLVYSICMIPGGVFIDRQGPRRALMVVGFGSAALGASTGLLGWAGFGAAFFLTSLILVRGVMGLLSAPLHPAGARVVGNWFPAGQRSWANGIVTAAAIAGVASSYTLFGSLIGTVGWPAGFVICGAATALLASLWTAMSADRPEQHPGVHPTELSWIQGSDCARGQAEGRGDAGWLQLLRSRNLLLVTMSYAAVGYFQYLFVYWMQYYFDRVLQLGDVTSKYYAGLLQVALAIGMPLGGWLSIVLSRRWGVGKGRALVAGCGMTLSAGFLALGVVSSQPFYIVLWFALAHAALGASEGPIWATAVDTGGRFGGTAAAICNTGGNLGGLLAPVLTPWISGWAGWGWGIGVGGLICLLGACCWFGVRLEPRVEVRQGERS